MNRHLTHGDDPRGTLINTPLKGGDPERPQIMNRFSGFKMAGETAEAVHDVTACESTPLKRGVNENRLAEGPKYHEGSRRC
jgi:hypothetical protein